MSVGKMLHTSIYTKRKEKKTQLRLMPTGVLPIHEHARIFLLDLRRNNELRALFFF